MQKRYASSSLLISLAFYSLSLSLHSHFLSPCFPSSFYTCSHLSFYLSLFFSIPQFLKIHFHPFFHTYYLLAYFFFLLSHFSSLFRFSSVFLFSIICTIHSSIYTSSLYSSPIFFSSSVLFLYFVCIQFSLSLVIINSMCTSCGMKKWGNFPTNLFLSHPPALSLLLVFLSSLCILSFHLFGSSSLSILLVTFVWFSCTRVSNMSTFSSEFFCISSCHLLLSYFLLKLYPSYIIICFGCPRLWFSLLKYQVPGQTPIKGGWREISVIEDQETEQVMYWGRMMQIWKSFYYYHLFYFIWNSKSSNLVIKV